MTIPLTPPPHPSSTPLRLLPALNVPRLPLSPLARKPQLPVKRCLVLLLITRLLILLRDPAVIRTSPLGIMSPATGDILPVLEMATRMSTVKGPQILYRSTTIPRTRSRIQ